MTKRQEELLLALVKEYVKTAEPVGSASLASAYESGVSPATVRNELAVLEEEGYIASPHTSAGRVPLEKGFRFAVSRLMETKEFLNKPAPQIERPEASGSPEAAAKTVARKLAEETHIAVIVAFSPRHFYYTGFSELFNQPEFRELGRAVNVGQLIDRLDDVVGAVYERVTPEITVWLGSENPFGPQCGTVVTRYEVSSGEGMLGLLGPMRMDYERSYVLVKTAKEALEEMV